MDFYRSIAAQYDDIFPPDETQVKFLLTSLPLPHGGKEILDVGCGTGSLAIALARLGFRVTAVDLDAAMIERAKGKGRGLTDLAFEQSDMRTLSGKFGPSSFDAVLCLGNTLVHLEQRSDVLSFLRVCRALIRDGGRLILQILNYDRILDTRLPGLPVIENDHIRFERIYHYEKGGRIAFRTILTVKATGSVVENEVCLYPLRKGEVEELLGKAGFQEIRFYGDFGKGILKAESLPLVVEAWG